MLGLLLTTLVIESAAQMGDLGAFPGLEGQFFQAGSGAWLSPKCKLFN